MGVTLYCFVYGKVSRLIYWYNQNDSSNSSLRNYLSVRSMDGPVCYCSDICVIDDFDHSSLPLLYFSSLSSSAHLLTSTFWHFTIRSSVSRWSSPRRKSPLAVCDASVVPQKQRKEMSEMFECMTVWDECYFEACLFMHDICVCLCRSMICWWSLLSVWKARGHPNACHLVYLFGLIVSK